MLLTNVTAVNFKMNRKQSTVTDSRKLEKGGDLSFTVRLKKYLTFKMMTIYYLQKIKYDYKRKLNTLGQL